MDNYVLVHDRAKRTTTIPARYRDEGNVSLSRPSGSKEAINSFEKDEWVRAMNEEISSLKKNHTWELVDQPRGQKLISSKWLYKIKEGIEGVQKPKYKSRVVARGFTQRAGIDYNEVFSPVVRHTSIRVILSLTACEDYELEQLDVKTAFLHGNLEETIYMKQPPGFEEGTGNKGKQRGHLLGVGRVLSGRATGGCPPPPQSTVDPADVKMLKKSKKSLTKQFGGTSGSGGCGDDEPDGDEDGDEDEED
ncbi:retrovirus-related pol polyprotein from transposon TNT 1-94 [Tanacetum coccineum]